MARSTMMLVPEQTTALPVEAFEVFFWADSASALDGVYRIDADGSSNADNWVLSASARGVCVDEETEKIFATDIDGTTNRIYVSDYDGGSKSILCTDETSSNIRGIDCDSNYVYWVQLDGDKIRKCDKATGDNVTTVRSLTNGAYDIKVDLVNGHLYYTQTSGAGIRRCDLDGDNDGAIFGTGTYQAFYIDPDNEHIYYSTGKQCRRVSYAGTGDTLIYEWDGGSPNNDHVYSLMVDLAGEKIYWIDQNDNNVGVCDLDGGNPDEEFFYANGSGNQQRGDIQYPQDTFYAKPNR